MAEPLVIEGMLFTRSRHPQGEAEEIRIGDCKPLASLAALIESHFGYVGDRPDGRPCNLGRVRVTVELLERSDG
jgi:hypothetical protein